MRKLIVLVFVMSMTFFAPAFGVIEHQHLEKPHHAQPMHWTWEKTHVCPFNKVGRLHWEVYGKWVTVQISNGPKVQIGYFHDGDHKGTMWGTPGIQTYHGYVHVDDDTLFIKAYITCWP